MPGGSSVGPSSPPVPGSTVTVGSGTAVSVGAGVGVGSGVSVGSGVAVSVAVGSGVGVVSGWASHSAAIRSTRWSSPVAQVGLQGRVRPARERAELLLGVARRALGVSHSPAAEALPASATSVES